MVSSSPPARRSLDHTSAATSVETCVMLREMALFISLRGNVLHSHDRFVVSEMLFEELDGVHRLFFDKRKTLYFLVVGPVVLWQF